MEKSSYGTYHSTYTPVNAEKYKGHENPHMRSSWERAFAKWLDFNPKVKNWASEYVVVPYKSKVDGRIHRYYIDFIVEFTDNRVVLFEIKPDKETKPPKKRQRNTQRYLTEVKTFATNISKWEAAAAYAKQHNVSFQILTEHDLRKLGIKVS